MRCHQLYIFHLKEDLGLRERVVLRMVHKEQLLLAYWVEMNSRIFRQVVRVELASHELLG